MSLKKLLFFIACWSMIPALLLANVYYSAVSSADLGVTDAIHGGEEEEWDLIIVGAGAAGSILARRASDAGLSVLVLEAGQFRYDDPVILTPNFFSVIDTLTTDPRYAETYPVVLSELSYLTYSIGRVVGGGAAHNYLLSVRGTPSIYNLWALISGNPQWAYNNLLPYMKLVETYTPNGTPIDLAQRGVNGRISVTQSPSVESDPFLQNIEAAGQVSYSDDYNDYTLGTTVAATTQSFVTPTNPHRSYSALEYLPMTGPDAVIDQFGTGLNGRKLQILTNARVLRFNTEGDNKVFSVEYVDTFGRDAYVRAACLKEHGRLILAAGAINTTNILVHSGVGPAADLAALGIRPLVDSPTVGTNTQNQYGSTMVLSGGSPATSLAFLSGAPYAVPADDGVRRIQVIVDAPATLEATSSKKQVFTVVGFLTNPSSTGQIQVVDKDPLVKPNFTYDFYSDGGLSNPTSDISLIVAFFRIIQTAAMNSGFKVLYPPPADFLDPTNEALAMDAQTTLGTFAIADHLVRTTPMGTSIANSAVDGNLKVRGLKNVWVGDIGAIPQTTNGNTCLPAYYIAEKLSAILGFSGLKN